MSKTVKVRVPNLEGVDKDTLLESIRAGRFAEVPDKAMPLIEALLEQVFDEKPPRRGPKRIDRRDPRYWKWIEAIKEYERRLESGDIPINKTVTKEEVARNLGLGLKMFEKALRRRKNGFFGSDLQFVLGVFKHKISRLIYESVHQSIQNEEKANLQIRTIFLELDFRCSKSYLRRIAISDIDVSDVAACRNELNLVRLIRKRLEDTQFQECQPI